MYDLVLIRRLLELLDNDCYIRVENNGHAFLMLVVGQADPGVLLKAVGFKPTETHYWQVHEIEVDPTETPATFRFLAGLGIRGVYFLWRNNDRKAELFPGGRGHLQEFMISAGITEETLKNDGAGYLWVPDKYVTQVDRLDKSGQISRR